MLVSFTCFVSRNVRGTDAIKIASEVQGGRSGRELLPNSGVTRLVRLTQGSSADNLSNMLSNMLQRTYRVEFDTDLTTKQVTAKLPTLNHTADFGDTAEEALTNLRELATGLIEVLLDEGKEIPPSDQTEKGGVFLSLSLNVKTRPKANRARR